MAAFTTDDRVTLNYAVHDFREPWLPRAETAVLLHHGFSKNLEFWTPFVPTVARRHMVVRFDARGCGRSSVPPPGADWSLDRLVDDVTSLLDSLQIAKVHFAGFESGGVVGLVFAAKRPDRTASLACFNTPHRSPASQSRFGGYLNAGHASPGDAVEAMGFDKWIASLGERGILVDLKAGPAVLEWAKRQAAQTDPSVARHWLNVMWDACWEDGELSKLLGTIRAPTLLVAGAEHKNGCEPPHLDHLSRKIPNARPPVYIPNVGTSVQLLGADACAARYLDFIGGLGAAS